MTDRKKIVKVVNGMCGDCRFTVPRLRHERTEGETKQLARLAVVDEAPQPLLHEV